MQSERGENGPKHQLILALRTHLEFHNCNLQITLWTHKRPMYRDDFNNLIFQQKKMKKCI